MSDFMGNIRAIINTPCPDPVEDYDGHKSWWKTLHDGYEGFAMQGCNACSGYEAKNQSIMEFEGYLEHYLKDTQNWNAVKMRLARLSLYKRSYVINRLDAFDKNHKLIHAQDRASARQYKREFLSNIGMSNCAAEIMCQESILSVTGKHSYREVDVIIGVGSDPDLLEERQERWGSYVELLSKIELPSLLVRSSQNKFIYKDGPFVNLWDRDGKAARDMYRMFGELLWKNDPLSDLGLEDDRLFIGKRWGKCSGPIYGGENAGFGSNECGVFISMVREDHMRRLISSGDGRWYNPNYFQNEGNSLDGYWGNDRDDEDGGDPDHEYSLQSRMDSIEFYATHSRFYTGIYDDDGFVTVVDGQLLDKDIDLDNHGHRYYLDCYE